MLVLYQSDQSRNSGVVLKQEGGVQIIQVVASLSLTDDEFYCRYKREALSL